MHLTRLTRDNGPHSPSHTLAVTTGPLLHLIAYASPLRLLRVAACSINRRPSRYDSSPPKRRTCDVDAPCACFESYHLPIAIELAARSFDEPSR